ncbi:MAG: hypothetical protein KDD46_03435, partial [Bdellovibrionales bacterium]|nr:hypothetical protein [Bdellovibrionales bacterium]
MRKHSTYTKAMWMALVVLSIGCSGTSTTQQTDPTLVDGDATQTQLGMVLRSGSQSFVQNALITSDNLALTTATACVEKIELKLPYGLSCSDVGFVTQSGLICEEEMDEEHGQMVLESKIKAYGPFTINMLDGSSQPSLENVQIPSGTYQEIEFEFRDDCGLGDEISMILEGTALHGDSESFP